LDKWHVYTFIADKPVKSCERKIKALTRRLSYTDFRATLIRINQIQRGWANYFKHAVAKHTFDRLQDFIWWRVVNWVMPTSPLDVEGPESATARPERLATDPLGGDRTVQLRLG
jgi:Group II intron, maturase-specific domain